MTAMKGKRAPERKDAGWTGEEKGRGRGCEITVYIKSANCGEIVGGIFGTW